ncbi:MAG: hypothetical protein EH225_13305 [Calditrichaeota bacterium]|nr:MAG: hypothetical protein EH225_13305 [Calditrichota bacterium]
MSWISVSSREDTIMYRTGFQLDETDISPEKYGEFQEFLSSVQQLNMKEIIIEQKDSSAGVLSGSN